MNALSVKDLHVKINESHILHGVTFDVPRNKVTALLGRNGVGKSTTLRSIMGFYEGTGSIELNGKQILGMQTYKIVQSGVAFVPEDREIFSTLTVKENLLLAARSKDSQSAYKFIFGLFPELDTRAAQQAGLAEALTKVAEDSTMLLVEQNLALVKRVAQHVIVMDQGRVVYQGGPQNLNDESWVHQMLGVSGGHK